MEKVFGTSEEIIGRWFAQGGCRDQIVLSTKVYQPMGTGPNDRRISAYHIRRACEVSLRLLRAGRHHRANGELAYHVLDALHAVLEASSSGRHIELTGTCERPAPLSAGLPQNKSEE